MLSHYIKTSKFLRYKKGSQSTSLIYSGSGVDRKPLACEDALVFEPNMIIQGK